MWFVIAGRLGSGKTTLARGLAATVAAKVVTVSDVLRHVSAEQGRPNPDREELQRLGSKLLSQGPGTLGRLILEAAPGEATVVVDGLRSADVVRWLRRELTGSILRVIFLEADREVRGRRSRGRHDVTAFDEADRHPVERLADDLRATADLVIDASRPAEEVLRRALAIVNLQP